FDIKNLALSSLPLFIVLTFNMIQIRIDHIMIKNLMGPSLLGEYSVVVKIGEILNFLPLVVSASLFPKLVDSYVKGVEEKRWSSLYFGSFFIIAFCIFLGLSLFGNWGISLLYGENYILAPRLISIYAFQLFFSYLFLAQSRFFLALDLLRSFLPLSFLSVIVNIILNVWLIPSFGVRGAIIASAISYGVPSLLGIIYNKNIRTSLRFYFDFYTFYKNLRRGLN
ncbi:MAG: polysaccharide biosynthesis C-terminal domain-containing protein, partial [Halobacteriovoraceae bacterium]|nr:polysaccharide biosynthesis C-terminal domain-containing protein [Halobacteriovoraceae bacterium]